MQLDPVNEGTGLYMLALEQVTGIDSAETYTIRFMARAEAPRNMKVLWRNAGNAAPAYYDSGQIALTTNAQLYQFVNIVPSGLVGTDPNAELRLQFGAESADIWICLLYTSDAADE